jgi:microcystin-dependent protein
MDQYLAMIIQFGGNFNPRGFALCNGQLLPLSQNTALFSLLGTFYGGNGTTTFALPDLRGRTALGQGAGPGLSQYSIGEVTGIETVSILTSNLPSHTHGVKAVASVGNQTTPSDFYLAEGQKTGTGPGAHSPNIYVASAPNMSLNPLSVSVNSGAANIPMNTMQPYLVITYLIAVTGIFPARN